MEEIAFIRRVEAMVYPPRYQLMAHYEVSSWDELAEYCEGTPHIETWEEGYAIWTKNEVVDIAAISAVSLAQLRHVWHKMAKTFGGKVVTADCREGTSYKLVQMAARRGLLEVLCDVPYIWGEERFHELELRFLPAL